ncbi:MAG TPA: hypothetical protein VN668_07925 [Stellaceae bacterium]|nr:hypothetical protein [Stellaceae bacterium]
MIVLDTLGKLRADGFGLFGCCHDCDALYRKGDPHPIGGNFDIDLDKLIAERGPDATCIRMVTPPCPRCGSRRTGYRITAPTKIG